MKKSERAQRRSLLKLLGIAGATSVVAPKLSATVVEPQPKFNNTSQSGYHETEHIRQFYRSLLDH
ncbi:formate dehydrogenase [Thalassotalea sp. Y01]|uniref:formate dehydrogenase n=1 Tax=Thalassotalea sp. Y01 TaxID=2729613 RepID=UPI00145D3D90|nr:formate dehydrogenase [Thalassotalea sp. Y01]NMP17264.1 formate dehydrogenase [Thalassotalea sp. Y01]